MLETIYVLIFFTNVSIKQAMLKINDPSPLAVLFSNFNMKMHNQQYPHPIKKPLKKYSTNKNTTKPMGTTIAMIRKSSLFL